MACAFFVNRNQFAYLASRIQIATSLPTQSTLHVVDLVVVGVVGGVLDVVLCHAYVLLVIIRAGSTQCSRKNTICVRFFEGPLYGSREFRRK